MTLDGCTFYINDISRCPLGILVHLNMKLVSKFKSEISSNFNGYSDRLTSALREKAIEQVKVKIALSGKTSGDFSQDELEVLVKDEEEKIKARFKNTLGLGLLAFLGLS